MRPFSVAKPALIMALAIGILVVFPFASYAAQGGRPHLSSDPEVNAARALIQAGKYDKALAILRPLTVNNENRTDVLFLTGLAAVRKSQLPITDVREQTALLDEAIASFHAILVERPELIRVRLEMARAFFLKGDDALSREHFERVLAGNPPSSMAANINRFLSAIRARRLWRGYFGFALAPDSNINSASESDTFYIGRLPFRRGAGETVRSGIGTVIWGGGEYQHPVDESMRVRAGVDVSRREYKGSDFDQTYLSVHLGPLWMLGASTELSMLGSFRRRWTAGNLYSREHGIRVELDRHFTRQMTGKMRLSWHRRNVNRNPLLNGPHTAFSLGGVWLIDSTLRLDATLGYGVERPKLLNWRNSTRWVQLGLSKAMAKGFTVGFGGEIHLTDYRGNWSPFTPGGEPRKDRTRIINFSVFNRGLTAFGFSPKLLLVNESRSSNAQLYDYKRNRAELQFVRQY